MRSELLSKGLPQHGDAVIVYDMCSSGCEEGRQQDLQEMPKFNYSGTTLASGLSISIS